MTSNDEDEMKEMLWRLRNSTGGTGFM
jgi:meiotically up-regulated gene 157 (Mug157) protein